MNHLTPNSARRGQSRAKLLRTVAEAVIDQAPGQAIVDYALALQAFDFPEGASEEALGERLAKAENRLIRTPCDLKGTLYKLRLIGGVRGRSGGFYDWLTAVACVEDEKLSNEKRLLASAWLDVCEQVRLDHLVRDGRGDEVLTRLAAEHQLAWDEAEAFEPDENTPDTFEHDPRAPLWTRVSDLKERMSETPAENVTGLWLKADVLDRWSRYIDPEDPDLESGMGPALALSLVADVKRLCAPRLAEQGLRDAAAANLMAAE